MTQYFRSKSVIIWPLLFAAILIAIRFFLIRLDSYENTVPFVKIILHSVPHIILLGELIIFVLLDHDKRHRVGVSLAILILGLGIFVNDVFILLYAVLIIITLDTIRVLRKKDKKKQDYLKYWSTVFLALTFLLFKFNLGNKVLIYSFLITSIICYIFLTSVYLRYYLEEKDSISHLVDFDISYSKRLVVIILVYVVCFIAAYASRIHLSEPIINYKFARYNKMGINNLTNNREEFQLIYEKLKALPSFSLVEFYKDSISLTVYDTTTLDSLTAQNYYYSNHETKVYPVQYNTGSNNDILDIIFLDSNKVELVNEKSSFILNKYWKFYGYGDQADPVLNKVLSYLGPEMSGIYDIVESLSKLNCHAVSKTNDIHIYYKGFIYEDFIYVFLNREVPDYILHGNSYQMEENLYWLYQNNDPSHDMETSFVINKYNI